MQQLMSQLWAVNQIPTALKRNLASMNNALILAIVVIMLSALYAIIILYATVSLASLEMLNSVVYPLDAKRMMNVLMTNNALIGNASILVWYLILVP